MTQELVVWVLLAGLIGLLWVMTCAILTKDEPTGYALEDTDQNQDDQKDRHNASKRTVAA
jgi:hypothetical protein